MAEAAIGQAIWSEPNLVVKRNKEWRAIFNDFVTLRLFLISWLIASYDIIIRVDSYQRRLMSLLLLEQ